MRPFTYASPERIDEALATLGDGSVPLAGGTDLLTLMKADLYAPERLVNIKALPEMSDIDYDTREGLQIGALTKLSDIESHAGVQQHYPALADALAVTATPQLRNMATLGGNLLQRPRCWYFRSSHIDCWLKGGDSCPMHDGENRFAAVFEQSPCWAVHPSDVAPVLLALDAKVRFRDGDGEAEIALGDLYQPPEDGRRTETVIGPRQLITSVQVPPPSPELRMTYVKAMDRKIWAFALVGVAAVVRFSGPTVAEARIVLSGVANLPVRPHAVERILVGTSLDDASVGRAAAAAFEGATPLSQNAYKLRLGEVLVRRALADLRTR